MAHKARTVLERLSANTSFIKNWAGAPMTTGAIAPSGSGLANKMASLVPLDNDLPVLEIGPGTGSVTRALLKHGVAPERLIALEYNTEFFELIGSQFPDIRVIQGDAYALSKTLQGVLGDVPKFAAIVSSLPLLTRPKEDREGLLQQSLTHLESGAPFIQFSYGFTTPVENPVGVSVTKSSWILRNIPPARVFVYRRIS
ncbi:MAG: methyltransferase domain-containing protein [Hyphomicrobiales bacterium]